MSQSLLASRRFAPLFWRQFFAAFNDNFLKNALVLLILAQIGGEQGASLVTLAGAIFIAPFFLLSALGGQIADKYRQGAHRTPAELRRNRRRRTFGDGLPPFQRADAVWRALFLRRHRRAVRSGEIRHPARSSDARRTCPPAMRWSKARPSSRFSTGTIAGGLAMQCAGLAPITFASGVMAVAALAYGAAWFIPSTRRAAPICRIDRQYLASRPSAAAAFARRAGR